MSKPKVIPDISQRESERFWALAKKSNDEEGCWLWQGYLDNNGYARFDVQNGIRIRTNRLSYHLTYGRFDSNLLVCHKCDNPTCVRPDHLFLGTVQQNSDDMVRKGRSAKDDRSPSRLYPQSRPRGEQHGMARFNNSMVKMIRLLHANGASQNSLAKQFQCAQMTISQIVHRVTWKHVP